MNINQLFEDTTKLLKSDVESQLFPIQVVFNRHIDDINRLKASGIPYSRMHKKASLGITLNYFYTLAYRATTNKKPH